MAEWDFGKVLLSTYHEEKRQQEEQRQFNQQMQFKRRQSILDEAFRQKTLEIEKDLSLQRINIEAGILGQREGARFGRWDLLPDEFKEQIPFETGIELNRPFIQQGLEAPFDPDEKYYDPDIWLGIMGLEKEAIAQAGATQRARLQRQKNLQLKEDALGFAFNYDPETGESFYPRKRMKLANVTTEGALGAFDNAYSSFVANKKVEQLNEMELQIQLAKEKAGVEVELVNGIFAAANIDRDELFRLQNAETGLGGTIIYGGRPVTSEERVKILKEAKQKLLVANEIASNRGEITDLQRQVIDRQIMLDTTVEQPVALVETEQK